MFIYTSIITLKFAIKTKLFDEKSKRVEYIS